MSAPADFIVQTKLNWPPIPPDLVPRERLLDLLRSHPDRSFTLVCAPAGYGKSTLVSRWVAAADVPGAWLSLDGEDNDLREFLKYVIAAVRTHSPRACRRTHDLLGAAELPPAPVLGAYLADDLQAIRRPFVLVLDDYHRIHERAVHDLIDQLLRHPPRSCHLTLVTRHDPLLALGALRANGRMLEVREGDLRFTPEETREVIRKVAGIVVGDDTLAHLDAGLEGWIAGLRLVCLTLRNQAHPEAFLAGLDCGTPSVQDYLVEEVLRRLPPEFEDVLLRVSVLDRFCAPLCEAVCGTETAGSPDGERFLRDLERANLFAIRLDAHREWFRYHHLFQNLLRRRLERRADPEEIRALHGRASRWFASQKLVDEALEHALLAGEEDHAADIVEAHRLEILNADRWPVLAGWLSRLPGEVVARRPELLLGEAWMAYYRFRIPELARIVERLDGLLGDGASRPAWEGETAMFRAYLCYWEGRTQEMLAHVAVAQDSLPATHDLMRADSEIYFGLAHHQAGQKDVAIDALTHRIREHPEGQGLLVTRRVITLAFIHLLAGDLREAAVWARQLGEVGRTRSPIYIESWSRYLLGCCHFHAADWERAERCFRWIAENRYVSHTATVMSSLIGLALTLSFRGRAEEAAEAERRMLDHAVETKDPANLALAESARARIGLLRGDAGAPGPLMGDASMATAFIFLEAPPVTHCRRLLATGDRPRAERARAAITRLEAETAASHNTQHRIDLLVLRAVACRALGRLEEANVALSLSLDLAAPGGWVRPFVEPGPTVAGLLAQARRDGREEQIDRLLAAFEAAPRAARPVAGAPLMDPLTNRELEVLELLAERLYDKEIAARLYISMATVKTHLRHIYEKLAVGNRRQAVTRATEVGLLTNP